MAANFSLSGGTTPQKRDSRWFRWMRILFYYQGKVGALPTNDPARSDTYRGTKMKVLKSLNSE